MSDSRLWIRKELGAMPTLAVGILAILMPTTSVGMAPITHERGGPT